MPTPRTSSLMTFIVSLFVQMYEASLGFQGSTFQVPDQPLGGSNNVASCSNDPFRPRTALTINKDGQPEFVAELI